MSVFTERRVRNVLAILFLAAAVSIGAGAARAASWAVLDADSGVFLGEEGGNHVQPPASLAKMMTLYLTFEALRDGRLHWNDALPFRAMRRPRSP